MVVDYDRKNSKDARKAAVEISGRFLASWCDFKNPWLPFLFWIDASCRSHSNRGKAATEIWLRQNAACGIAHFALADKYYTVI